jgi:hypothetical protein
MAYTAFSYESDLNVRRPAVLEVGTSAASSARGPARRVVWVLVDGLRLDASREMPVLNRLRADGEDVSARAEFPTFSGPNYVAQASGIEPAASGVLSNEFPGEVALDSVFRRAKLAGLRTAMRVTDAASGITETYASWTDEAKIEEPGADLPPAHLVFVHIGFVDWAAHAFGAQSTEYHADVARADEAIGRIARSLDPTRDALVVTSDHGNLDQGGHGGTERDVTRIPIVVWGAGAVRRTHAGRGRDVGPTIASLLGIGPLDHATGRSLVRGDGAAVRQREAARAMVRAAGASHVDYVPIGLPITVGALLFFRGGAWPRMRRLIGATTYAVVFAGLVVATNTTSFSVSNHSAFFGARLTTLCALAALAQLGVGGRSSLVSAALVASLAVLGTALVAAQQPLAPANGTLRFLPIPAITGLAFVCLMTAAIGRRDRVRAGVRLRAPLAAETISWERPEATQGQGARGGSWSEPSAPDRGATVSN